jgi:hypothetical protein
MLSEHSYQMLTKENQHFGLVTKNNILCVKGYEFENRDLYE